MRYCFVLPHFDETVNSFSKLLAPVVQELIRSGDEVTIVSANAGYHGRYRNQHHPLPGRTIKPAFLNYLFFVVVSSVWLKWNRKRFDLIHNLGIGATLVQDVMTAHACHRSWLQCKWRMGQYVSMFANPLHALVLIVEGLNYRRKIPVIAVIESLAQEIRTYYPMAAGSIVVIPNGVPPAPPITAVERIDNKSFVISFASNDHGKKGLAALIAAMQLAKNQGKSWRLLVLGHDSREQKWKDLVRERGLDQDIIFVGHVTNIHDHMAASDVFCLPSNYEPFGLVYLEAAHAGIPIVGTDVGVYPELVNQHFPELPLALPVEVSKLYAALARVETDFEFRDALRRQTRKAATQFTEERMLRQTLAFYGEVLTSKGRRGTVGP